MLKAILFDLGGTLFDFRPLSTRTAFDESARRTYAHLQSMGFTLPPYRTYAGRQFAAIRRAFLRSRLQWRWRDFNCYDLMCDACRWMRIQLDDEQLRDLAWRWYEMVTDYCTVAEDVVPTLEKIRQRGIGMAIVSNTFIPGFVLDRHMAMHRLLEFFPVRVYSSELGWRKPHPRMLQTALEGLGVKVDEAIFIGDTLKVDIAGAHRMGLRAILRDPGATSRTHRVADHAVRGMTELWQLLPLLGMEAGVRDQGSGAQAEEAPDVHPGLRCEPAPAAFPSAGEDTGGTGQNSSARPVNPSVS